MVIEFLADEQSSSGVCNIGKFNYYLGKGGMDSDRPALYDIDFCRYPEAPCASQSSEELPWTGEQYDT